MRLITAQEARDRSVEASQEDIKELNKIITEACEKGKRTIDIGGHFSLGTVSLLQLNGFKITQGKDYTIIRW